VLTLRLRLYGRSALVQHSKSTGFSAPASPENYDEEVGKRYAYDNAFKPLWQLEGYLLREQLFIQYEADR
jgi:hypothetical protein